MAHRYLGRMKGRLISVALAIVVVGAFSADGAIAAKNGTYKGKTAGKLDVRIKVKNNRVTLFDSDLYAYPIGITTFVFPPSGQKGRSAKIKANGKFKVVFQADPGSSFDDDKRTLTGQFKGSKVSGTMKVEGLLSGDDTYKAKR